MEAKFLRNVLYGMAMLSMASCMEEELTNEVPMEAEVEADIDAPSSAISVFDGTIEEVTRTYIDENDAYETGVGTMWRTKETIGVYGSYAKNAKFTSTNSKNSGTVSFSGLILGTPKYAYYPYSENNSGVSQTAVKGHMPATQEYHQTYKDIVGDYRAGTLDSRSWFSSTFTFQRLVSILLFKVDATGTPLEGSNLRSITLKVGNKRKMAGDFTINLQTQATNLSNFATGDDSITVVCTNEPTLMSGQLQRIYMTALPSMQKGDEMTFIIRTTTHEARLTRSSAVTYAPNGLYNFPLTLANFSDLEVRELGGDSGLPEGPAVTPVLTSMKFTVEDNPGKILGYEFTHVKGSSKSYTITEKECTIDEANKKVKLYVPYLNNRKLVPTFEIPEGTMLVSEAGEVISSETEVDFSIYKQLAVINSAGEYALYDVELTNTGLPVVVVNQVTGTVSSSTGDTQKGSKYWYEATGTKWQPKDSDWEMTEGVDNFMVYNADGTPALTDKNGSLVEEPILASTRVRGNVSQQMPKKPFAVKLDKKHSVLGMPAHKRWVLLAGWNDRTQMRNAIAYDIAKLFEKNLEGSIAWNPSVQHVELVYNGVHVGTYLLGEQIKIDGDRLDIKDPLDAEDNPYTGNPEDFGYLLESDDGYDEDTKFITKNYVPFLFKDDADEGYEMLNYVKNIVTTIEDSLYNSNYTEAYKTLDMNSMVDFLLIQEVMMNGELQHPKSVYTYINNGKMYAGPVWDFDWQTIPNIDVINSSFDDVYTGGRDSYKFEYTKSMLEVADLKRSTSTLDGDDLDGVKTFMWYPMLVKDATFKAKAAERWNTMSGLITNYANTGIDAMADKIRTSVENNWDMWEFTATSSTRYNTYGVGGGFCGDEKVADFNAAVELLKTNLKKRVSGMSYVSNQTWPNIEEGSSSGSGGSWWPFNW